MPPRDIKDMNKARNILQIINLLNHRQTVTMDTIRKTCNIPERTAYRYLNTISEANVPVYYDRTTKSYTLARSGVLAMDDLSLGEAVIVTVALKLLQQQVNVEYGDDVEKLVTKLLVRQHFPVEDMRDMIEHKFERENGSKDLSDLVSSILIHAAMACEKQVRIHTRRGSNAATTTLKVDKPSLVFKKHWRLGEGERFEVGSSAAMEDIKKVTIL
jgi:predicted DNA-binding transcriptional regulator YafY